MNPVSIAVSTIGRMRKPQVFTRPSSYDLAKTSVHLAAQEITSPAQTGIIKLLDKITKPLSESKLGQRITKAAIDLFAKIV